MKNKVLISGGSIAANTLAWWLIHWKFDVTVVESSPKFRDGGQNVDVRGAAREVLKRMNLEQAVEDLNTGEEGWSFVDENNNIVAEFDMEDADGKGPTAELEILRGDLARILYESFQEQVEYRFNDQITALQDSEECVSVSFKSGRNEKYDLVIIAEGVGSTTRELVFQDENEPKWLDIQMGYFTIPKGSGDNNLARWYNPTGGRSVFLRPDNKGTTRAVLTIQKESEGEEKLKPEEQKKLLIDRFIDAEWETPRVLDGLKNTKDFYFDVLRQVNMPRWHKGRIAITGDAAWCVTPLAGIGTTLAIVGAYVLAGELSRNKDHNEAFAAYEKVMRAIVEKSQDVSKTGVRLYYPRTRIGVAIQRTLLGIMATPAVQNITTKLITPKAEEIELPNYND